MRLYEFLAFNIQVAAESMETLAKELDLPPQELDERLKAWDPPAPKESDIRPSLFSEAEEVEPGLPFAHLEQALPGQWLSETQEDCVWSYPYYHAWMEAGVALESQGEADNLIEVFESARAYWLTWLESLDMDQETFLKVRRRVDRTWVRLRTRIIDA